MKLQDELANLTTENKELKKQCHIMNKEHDLIEKENSKLLKDYRSLKEINSNQEKIIYGKTIKPIIRQPSRRKNNSMVRN